MFLPARVSVSFQVTCRTEDGKGILLHNKGAGIRLPLLASVLSREQDLLPNCLGLSPGVKGKAGSDKGKKVVGVATYVPKGDGRLKSRSRSSLGLQRGKELSSPNHRSQVGAKL